MNKKEVVDLLNRHVDAPTDVTDKGIILGWKWAVEALKLHVALYEDNSNNTPLILRNLAYKLHREERITDDVAHYIREFADHVESEFPSQKPAGMKWVTGEYERLWEWANNPERVRSIPMYVDYSYTKEDGTKFRDICHMKDVRFGFGARGIGYSSYSIYLPDDPEYAKERFLSDCKADNVEWLDESNIKENDKKDS